MQGIILSIYQDAKARLESERSRAIEDAKIEAETQFIQPKYDELEKKKQEEIAAIDQKYEDQKRYYRDEVINKVETQVAKSFDDEISNINKKIAMEG